MKNEKNNNQNNNPDLLLIRYQAILAAIPDIIMEVDNNKTYTWANQTGKDFFGEDVLGKKAEDYFVAKQETYTKVKPLFEGSEDTIYLESWQRRKDGKKCLLAWWCRTLKNDKEEIIGAISTARDITQRKKIEEEIINSKKLLQKIIDLLPIRIFWKNKNLKYLGCNKIFALDAGKNDPADLIGKDDFQMTWKDQADLYRNDDKNVIESNQSKLNFEEPQTTPEGKTIWLRTSKIPLTDLRGDIMGILGSYEDITKHKQAEDELQLKIKEMEKMNKLMVGRELNMIKLKKDNKELKEMIDKLKNNIS